MRNNYLTKTGLLFLILALSFQACKKDQDQDLKDQEMRLLEQYLKDNNITQEPTASGLYYIELVEGTGRSVKKMDIVDMSYTTFLVDNSLLYTSEEDVAKQYDVFDPTKVYGPIRVQAGGSAIPGLDEGLQMMKEGGKAELIMPSSINGFVDNTIGHSGPYSTHIYTVEVIHTFDDPVVFQDSMIQDYLVSNGFDSSYYKTESGIYYIEERAGTGDLIDDGDMVKLWYTGSFLDGRVFDSNLDDVIMQLVMPANNYIPAWDEALRLMSDSTIAKIIVPYQMAYGSAGKGSIPPYKTLVFDIDISSVTK